MDMIDAALDRLVRTRVRLFTRSCPAFLLCGVTGLILAIVLAVSLAAYRGLPIAPLAAILGAGVATLLALTMAMKIITGKEQLIYYHHEIAILTVTALLLHALDLPLLPYLDLTVLGIGMILACGRVGCLMVGCCHGRPHRWGVRYRAEHVAEGFTSYYAGLRLFPIQAVESLWVLGVVMVGSVMVARGDVAGSALVWYTVAYGIGRFVFEFVRGDAERPYHAGFSEAQWISLALLVSVAVVGEMGMLPFAFWHIVAAIGVGCTVIVVTLWRRSDVGARHALLAPRHVGEIARAVERVKRQSDHPTVCVECTSRGVRISAGTIAGPDGPRAHYTLSSASAPMTSATASTLKEVILQLDRNSREGELIEGNAGTFHLLLHPPS